jgi:erythronate-4-phosphate dehydrogenase
MKIIIDDKIPFIKGLLEPFAEVKYISGNKILREDIIDADALIIRTRTICDKALLEGTSVKFISTATIGSDHIDTLWCDANNIKWATAPGCNSGSVMQYITSAILTLAYKYQLELSDITLGVIGIGNVGKKVVSMASALGMRVLKNDPPREMKEGKGDFNSLDDILALSDIITVHVPLTFTGDHQTYHLADEQFFSLMKKGAYFINSSRGQVCNENALKKVIKNKSLNGCVLDVWETEPNPDPVLLKSTDVATPHIAGYSLDGKFNATVTSVNNLCEFFRININLPSKDILPLPADPLINISKCHLDEQKALHEVILRTYPVSRDSDHLKKNPSRFEDMRGNYWPRREFMAYTIAGNHKIKETLLRLGFQM